MYDQRCRGAKLDLGNIVLVRKKQQEEVDTKFKIEGRTKNKKIIVKHTLCVHVYI